MRTGGLGARWAAGAPYMLGVLRVVTALSFIPFGSIKLFAFPAAMPGGGTAPPFTLLWFAGVIEFFGGALALIGLFTRPVAFILSGEMAFAYFIGHAPRGLLPQLNGGIAAVLFCFVWLYISAAGAGKWSVDGGIKK